MKNKKSIMLFSGVLIIIFHLWIYINSQSPLEVFFKQISYVGVDVFFLLSGYSLASRPVDNYLEFALSRFKMVYLKFAVFAVVAFFYAGWTVKRLLETVFYIDLVKKGGGAFLWFLPAIMIFYLLFPVFQKCDQKNRIVTAVVVTAMWLILAWFGSQFPIVKHLFIIWNRVPVFLVGYYLAQIPFEVFDKPWFKAIIGTIFISVGLVIAYRFAFQAKAQFPFVDTFYLCLIPLSVGLVYLISIIPENDLIRWTGSSTLEMYAVQMIFGYDFANKVYLLTKNVVLTNILTLVSVILVGTLIQYLFRLVLTKK